MAVGSWVRWGGTASTSSETWLSRSSMVVPKWADTCLLMPDI